MEASQAERKRSFIQLGLLQKAEYFGFLAAAVLFVSLFLPWFDTSSNVNSRISGREGPLTAFETFGILDLLLVAACTAPFILAYIIVRGHELGWRPGEVTAIVGIIAFVLILCNGVILGKPGNPPGEIAFGIGYPIALVASFGILVSGFLRQGQNVKRKPPGV